MDSTDFDKETFLHSQEILEAMEIRQDIDAEIPDLYQGRSLNDCASFLLKYLKPSISILDCGCGSGKLAMDFALNIYPGSVVGIDANEDHLKSARTQAQEKGINNVTFKKGDLYALPFKDNTFDIAFLHTVLCNLHEPVTALKELKRVMKPDGMIAAREPDYYSSIIYPENPAIAQGLRILASVQSGYSDAIIGRKLRKLFKEAGIEDTDITASCDYYGSEESLKKITHYLKSQTMHPEVIHTALEKNLATKATLQNFWNALDALAINPDALYIYTLVEAIGKNNK